jgi:ATP-dependent Clp protease ATP-binding subunit ClpX
MDTTNILFICGGTFVGIEEIIAKRLGRRTLGFGQEASKRVDMDLGELLAHVTSDDILQFGLIPELVGRLPVVSPLGPLDMEALIRVLKEPKNALVKQYQELFGMESAELAFSDGALRAIAERAMEKDTGARGLRSIMEEIMLDILFELPDQPNGSSYKIDEDIVYGRAKLFSMPEPKHKSA